MNIKPLSGGYEKNMTSNINKQLESISNEKIRNEFLQLHERNKVKKIKKSKSETRNGIILTMQNPRTSGGKLYSECLKKYQEDPDKAVTQGYVKEYKKDETGIYTVRRLMNDGKISVSRDTNQPPSNYISFGNEIYALPLDNRKIAFGKENYNYLKEIKQREYTRIQGLLADGDGFARFMMTVYPDDNNFVIPFNRPVTFQAPGKQDKDGIYFLKYDSSITKFEVDKDINIKLDEGFLEMFIPSISIDTELSDLYDESDKYRMYAIKGEVTDLWYGEETEEKPNPFNTYYLNGDTKVLCHPYVPHDFGINSFVYMWGTIGKGKKWDKVTKKSTDEVEYTLWGEGVYALVNTSPAEPAKPPHETMRNKPVGESWD